MRVFSKNTAYTWLRHTKYVHKCSFGVGASNSTWICAFLSAFIPDRKPWVSFCCTYSFSEHRQKDLQDSLTRQKHNIFKTTLFWDVVPCSPTDRCKSLLFWRWRRQVLSKHWQCLPRLHGVTLRKIIFGFDVVRNIKFHTATVYGDAMFLRNAGKSSTRLNCVTSHKHLC